jgi:hypothetical protein
MDWGDSAPGIFNRLAREWASGIDESKIIVLW